MLLPLSRTPGPGHGSLVWPASSEEVQIFTLGIECDSDVRKLLRTAIHDAWPAACQFGWHVSEICELPEDDADVGYSDEDGTVFVKVRIPGEGGGNVSCRLYSYSFVLSTLLHELAHFSYLGHGKNFYRRLIEAVGACGAQPAIRRQVEAHVCAELIGAICDDDRPRARALLAVLPQAASSSRPDSNGELPLEYAAHHGRVTLARTLLKAGADASTSQGSVSPAARAVARGNSRTANVLLGAGSSLAVGSEPKSDTRSCPLSSHTHLDVPTIEKTRRRQAGGSSLSAERHKWERERPKLEGQSHRLPRESRRGCGGSSGGHRRKPLSRSLSSPLLPRGSPASKAPSRSAPAVRDPPSSPMSYLRAHVRADGVR